MDSPRVCIQLHVPIEIVPPTFWRIADPDGNGDDRIPARFDRFPGQSHVCFVRGSPAFPIIATPTRRDDIFPCLFAALRDGNDVVEGQIFGLELVIAILTGVAVSGEDIDPRKLDRAMAVFKLDHLEEPHDRREFDRD